MGLSPYQFEAIQRVFRAYESINQVLCAAVEFISMGLIDTAYTITGPDALS
jgi:hypothetical protein